MKLPRTVGKFFGYDLVRSGKNHLTIPAIPDPQTFLKMDTQGFDLDVVKGAGSVMRTILALQSEIAMLPMYDGMPGYLEALAEYKKLGFEVTGFYPVSRDQRSLAVIEFDCVLARRPGIP